MKNRKIWLGIGIVVLAVLVALFALFSRKAPQAQPSGDKKITVEIIHGDQSTKTVEIQTDSDYLGPVLMAQEDLVSGENGSYGLYITQVDGEAASDDDRTWWCITKGGAEVTTGVDTTPISDGDNFELTLMTY